MMSSNEFYMHKPKDRKRPPERGAWEPKISFKNLSHCSKHNPKNETQEAARKLLRRFGLEGSCEGCTCKVVGKVVAERLQLKVEDGKVAAQRLQLEGCSAKVAERRLWREVCGRFSERLLKVSGKVAA